MEYPYQRHQKHKETTTTESSSNLAVKRLPSGYGIRKTILKNIFELIANVALTCVGFPTKDKKEYPLFDYEKLIYDALINGNELHTEFQK